MPNILNRFSVDLNAYVRLLEGGADDFDPLLDLIADARFVLIGEAPAASQRTRHG